MTSYIRVGNLNIEISPSLQTRASTRIVKRNSVGKHRTSNFKLQTLNLIGRYSLLTSLYLYSFLSLSQDIRYARYIIDSLTSLALHGRGYVADGDELAANFIAGEFEKNGLQKFGKKYFQEFKTD